LSRFHTLTRQRGKNRPALVVQNDGDNLRLDNTVIAMISGNILHASEPTQLLIDPATKSSKPSGLRGASVVKCCNLLTVRQQDVLSVIGKLSDGLLSDVDRSLKLALGLS